jgi:hypothetical protein
MTADVASAVGTTTRAIADVATSSAVQKATLKSPGNNLGEIVTQAIKWGNRNRVWVRQMDKERQLQVQCKKESPVISTSLEHAKLVYL